jgi:HK97 gp10 family phage protein
MKTFTAQVDEWARKSEARMIAVVRDAAQKTRDLMQIPTEKGGNMPVDTGTLRNSIQAGINAPKVAPAFRPANPYDYDEAGTALVIAGLEPGDTLYLTYSANYARFVEYGANGRPGRGFVRLATQKWKRTVAASAIEARRAAGDL